MWDKLSKEEAAAWVPKFQWLGYHFRAHMTSFFLGGWLKASLRLYCGRICNNQTGTPFFLTVSCELWTGDLWIWNAVWYSHAHHYQGHQPIHISQTDQPNHISQTGNPTCSVDRRKRTHKVLLGIAGIYPIIIIIGLQHCCYSHLPNRK